MFIGKKGANTPSSLTEHTHIYIYVHKLTQRRQCPTHSPECTARNTSSLKPQYKHKIKYLRSVVRHQIDIQENKTRSTPAGDGKPITQTTCIFKFSLQDTNSETPVNLAAVHNVNYYTKHRQYERVGWGGRNREETVSAMWPLDIRAINPASFVILQKCASYKTITYSFNMEYK